MVLWGELEGIGFDFEGDGEVVEVVGNPLVEVGVVEGDGGVPVVEEDLFEVDAFVGADVGGGRLGCRGVEDMVEDGDSGVLVVEFAVEEEFREPVGVVFVDFHGDLLNWVIQLYSHPGLVAP